jgi:hypothetical protein
VFSPAKGPNYIHHENSSSMPEHLVAAADDDESSGRTSSYRQQQYQQCDSSSDDDATKVENSCLSHNANNGETFKLLEGIGSGGYGVVLKVEETSSGAIFAMKVLHHDQQRPQLAQSIVNEISALQHLKTVAASCSSPFVQSLHDVYEDSVFSNIYIASEYIPGGDALFSHVQSKSFSNCNCCCWVLQLSVQRRSGENHSC